jgi:hypothetical protein
VSVAVDLLVLASVCWAWWWSRYRMPAQIAVVVARGSLRQVRSEWRFHWWWRPAIVTVAVWIGMLGALDDSMAERVGNLLYAAVATLLAWEITRGAVRPLRWRLVELRAAEESPAAERLD